MPAPFINIHTHSEHKRNKFIEVQNIFPGESFAAFSGRNFYSVGLHPWHLKSFKENNKMMQMMEDALEFDHVIFVGECGLDKKIEFDFTEQLRVFKAQVFMAEEFEYPLIIHCVKAYNKIVEIHNEMKPTMPWIMHGYNGSVELTKQLLKKNFLFSFGKSILKENSKASKSLEIIPLENLFFETDEFEGSLEMVYEMAAKIKDVSLEELKTSVWENFARIENSITNRS